MTILKHVDGKTVAVKLGNYQSHGNHKRSLLARNLSNPLPPASLFHGNLAWEREGEGYRRRERKGSTKKGWKKTGKGASFAMKNNWRSFCATRTKAGSEGGGGGAAICAHEILFLFRYGIENEGMCSISFSFSFLSFLSFFSIIGPRESFPDFFLFEFEIGKSWNLIWFARNFGRVSRKILDLG